jgi:hypothetical protein
MRFRTRKRLKKLALTRRNLVCEFCLHEVDQAAQECSSAVCWDTEAGLCPSRSCRSTAGCYRWTGSCWLQSRRSLLANEEYLVSRVWTHKECY